MNPEQIIYNAILQGAMKAGVSQDIAEIHAELGVDQSRRNTYGTTTQLIDAKVKEAVKFKVKP